ncbi:MAG: thioredoxin family protein [Clostridium sp.]|nr:thioredoxin family protein [Clostridium sp.]
MNKKKILIISLITFIFILFIVLINISNKMNEEKIKSTITMNSKLSDVVYDENKLNIYLFWGKGCPHCEEEWKFLNRIAPKYYDKIHVYGFEVWNSEENQKIMNEFKDKLNISKNSGIPLTIIEDKYYIGYDESYNDEILKLIKNNHKNSKDIYLDKNL